MSYNNDLYLVSKHICQPKGKLPISNHTHVHFASSYAKIGAIQGRLAWPLHKDDMQIPETFHTSEVSQKDKHLMISLICGIY